MMRNDVRRPTADSKGRCLEVEGDKASKPWKSCWAPGSALGLPEAVRGVRTPQVSANPIAEQTKKSP